MAGLRERKREQTTTAIVAAALSLFESQGYEATTVAQIAEAAEVSPRTLFRRFPAKDAILFAGNEDRIAGALELIRAASPDEEPATVLLRALREGYAQTQGDPSAPLRLRLIAEVPAIAGRAYRLQAQAEDELTAALVAAFPGRVDERETVALVGAMVGAITALARHGIEETADAALAAATTASAATAAATTTTAGSAG